MSNINRWIAALRTARATALLLLFFLLIGPISLPGVQARISPPKLVEIIKLSDLIVTGTVVAISTTGDVKIAEVAVERVLKGDRLTAKVYFWATRTWACDVSYAVQDESGLYFLHRASPDRETEMRFSPLYYLAGSGYGRFIRTGGDTLEAQDLVVFPKSVPVNYRRRSKYFFAAVVRLGPILRLISTINKRTSSSALSRDVRR